VKAKLNQSWRYKTLAVIKNHKNHFSSSLGPKQITNKLILANIGPWQIAPKFFVQQIGANILMSDVHSLFQENIDRFHRFLFHI